MLLSERFVILRDRLETEPDCLNEMFEMIQEEYPKLNALLVESPHLLLTLLSGNVPNFELINQNLEDVDEENLLNDENSDLPNLTQEDKKNIQNVRLKAYDYGI